MTDVTTLRPGEHFMFKNFEWVCLDQNHTDGGVLAIMATPWAKDVKFCPSDKFADLKGNWNNYRTSNVRGILSDMTNSVFGGKGLLAHTVDLVADNGDRAYGTVQDSVFILTCDEYRKYRDYIPHYDSWIWTATPWYCGEKGSNTDYASYVIIVHADDKLCNCCVYIGGAALAALFVVFYALGVSAGREATQQREEDISMEHTHGGEK